MPSAAERTAGALFAGFENGTGNGTPGFEYGGRPLVGHGTDADVAVEALAPREGVKYMHVAQLIRGRLVNHRRVSGLRGRPASMGKLAVELCAHGWVEGACGDGLLRSYLEAGSASRVEEASSRSASWAEP